MRGCQTQRWCGFRWSTRPQCTACRQMLCLTTATEENSVSARISILIMLYPRNHIPLNCTFLHSLMNIITKTNTIRHGNPLSPASPISPSSSYTPIVHFNLHRKVSAHICAAIRSASGLSQQDQRGGHASGHMAPGENEPDRLALRPRASASPRASSDDRTRRDL